MPSFWQDPLRAQATLRWLAQEKALVASWQDLERRTRELEELTDLARREADASLEGELERDSQALAQRLAGMEFQLLLQGEFDSRNALLSVHAGAGGTEAQDWAQILLRMYLRWAERRGFKAEVLETTSGGEAGVKSALVEVRGDYAYGYLRAEHGVHRLVRLSPFDADHARHTSFALVEVLPEAEKDADIKLNPEEIKMETFRSSGPGGQHMQKTSTAVRLTHLPTGITVSYQSERSQYQNREVALRVLHSRLLERELQRRREERDKLKGKHLPAQFGNQIRSYVLHPYKMVKDHRTGYETAQAQGVLDGELDGFMEAYLRSQVASTS